MLSYWHDLHGMDVHDVTSVRLVDDEITGVFSCEHSCRHESKAFSKTSYETVFFWAELILVHFKSKVRHFR
jgi:hypothetical protein